MCRSKMKFKDIFSKSFFFHVLCLEVLLVAVMLVFLRVSSSMNIVTHLHAWRQGGDSMGKSPPPPRNGKWKKIFLEKVKINKSNDS